MGEDVRRESHISELTTEGTESVAPNIFKVVKPADLSPDQRALLPLIEVEHGGEVGNMKTKTYCALCRTTNAKLKNGKDHWSSANGRFDYTSIVKHLKRCGRDYQMASFCECKFNQGGTNAGDYLRVLHHLYKKAEKNDDIQSIPPSWTAVLTKHKYIY